MRSYVIYKEVLYYIIELLNILQRYSDFRSSTEVFSVLYSVLQ